MQAYKIRLLKKLVQTHQGYVVFLCKLLVGIGIVSDYIHIKSADNLRKLLSNRAQSQDAKCLAIQRNAENPSPITSLTSLSPFESCLAIARIIA